MKEIYSLLVALCRLPACLHGRLPVTACGITPLPVRVMLDYFSLPCLTLFHGSQARYVRIELPSGVSVVEEYYNEGQLR